MDDHKTRFEVDGETSATETITIPYFTVTAVGTGAGGQLVAAATANQGQAPRAP